MTEQLTHLDIAVSGFWGGWFDTLMSDFLALIPLRPTIQLLPQARVLKKCAYEQRVREIEHAPHPTSSFSYWGYGKWSHCFLQKAASCLAMNWNHLTPPPCPGYAVAWLSLCSSQPSSASGVPVLPVATLPSHHLPIDPACHFWTFTAFELYMTHSLFILAHYSVKLLYFYIIFHSNSQIGLIKKDNTCWQAATSLDYICWCSQLHDTCTKKDITVGVIGPVTCCCLPRGSSVKPSSSHCRRCHSVAPIAVVHIPIAIEEI